MDPQISSFLVSLLTVVLETAGVALLGWGLKLAGDYIKTKVSADLLSKAAGMAVQAVEQLDKSGQLDDLESKKDAALRIAQGLIEAELAARGIKMKVDLVALSNLIEAKVWELLNSQKPQEIPAGEG